jgi:hypothetical protein
MPRTRAEAFNEWMRLYTEEPERFAHEWQTVGGYLAETKAGEVPSYGAQCDAFLAELEK